MLIYIYIYTKIASMNTSIRNNNSTLNNMNANIIIRTRKYISDREFCININNSINFNLNIFVLVSLLLRIIVFVRVLKFNSVSI